MCFTEAYERKTLDNVGHISSQFVFGYVYDFRNRCLLRSKLIRLVVRRNKAFTFRRAVLMLLCPLEVSCSRSVISSKGALMSVSGVTYIMRRIDEEAYFLIGFFPLFFSRLLFAE